MDIQRLYEIYETHQSKSILFDFDRFHCLFSNDKGKGKGKGKILPWYQILHTSHFAPMESCWGVPSPNPATMKNGKQHDLNHAVSRFIILSY